MSWLDELATASWRQALLQKTEAILSSNSSLEALVSDNTALGPSIVSCALADGGNVLKPVLDHAFNNFPLEGNRAAVGIRSISKMITAATVLTLVDRGQGGLRLDTALSHHFPACAGTRLANATAGQMLSMGTQLDNRLNALWKATSGRQDHAGFPPFCDSVGASVEECITQVICPAYDKPERLPPQLAAAAERATVELRCDDANVNCQSWAASGECQANPKYMQKECLASCRQCERGERLTAEKLGGDKLWWDNNASDGRTQLTINVNCKYDNLSYMLLDAMVLRATGREIWQWMLELVARPARLDDMLRCMKPPEQYKGKGIPGCYRMPASPAAAVVSAEWELWRGGWMVGGPESRTWAGNSYFASSLDMTRFLALLANRGKLDGVRVLSSNSVQLMLSDMNDRGLECQGMDTFGLGIGHCIVNDLPRSMCKTDEWWGWGSTYGSRVMMMPRRRRGLDGALVCAIIANLPTEQMPKDASGNLVRLASRQHSIAHQQAASLREIFPLLPS